MGSASEPTRTRRALTKVRPGSRRLPQQQRAQATVTAILDAAADLFCARGFKSTSSNAVAEHAGVSIGSLYQYFSNKMALLEGLRDRHIKELWDCIGSACEDAIARPWPDALRYVITQCSAYNAERVALLALIHRELPVHSEAKDRTIVAETVFQQKLRRFLEAHQASIKVSAEEALFIMPVLGRGVFSAAAVQKPDVVKSGRLVDEITSIMLGYLT